VARTLEGPGAATEIWTSLSPVDARRTDIEVEFLVPDVPPARRAAVGDGYVALYTHLWDQDEAMMRRRSWLLESPRSAPRAASEPMDLGPAAELEARQPLRVSFAGRPVVVTRCEGEWLAFDGLCPHSLGPLDEGQLFAGRVVCPWHGYGFDVRSGRGCDAAKRFRLAPAPRVEVAGGRVRLLRR
jgi:nitrite reductase/ring-hydroxylating ferredoxin subunit